MEAEVLIIAEHDGAEVDPITHDLLAWGANIAAANSWKTGVLVVGSGIDAIAERLKNSPADTVLTLDAPALKDYNPVLHVEAIAGAVKMAPRVLLLGHTYVGIELAGGLATRLGAPLWSNCLSVATAGAGLCLTRPITGGAYIATLDVSAAPNVVLTMQRGATPATKPVNKSAALAALSVPESTSAPRIKLSAETRATFAEDITKADLIVSVGRGVGQQDRIQPFADLAQVLGGIVGASRPLVDMGWMTVDHQVGLSGRTVRPKVYLAFGISGAAQHLAGMRDTPCIIAVNNDANAPIFQVAHYGVVADMFEILPALMAEAGRK